MPGSQADEIDWENLSNKELHDKFQQMMTEQVQDVLNNFEEAMEKRDEHWSKTRPGDDGMCKGNKNGVTSDDFRTLKTP